MKIEKRNRYINHLYACIHTLSGRCFDINDSKIEFEPIIKTCTRKKQHNKCGYVYYLQMNPNKIVEDGDMLRSYSEFKSVMTEALTNVEAAGFSVTRADLSFNSDELEDYELFKKLNRLLVCCIADAYNVKNFYKTNDGWTDKSLSIAIKSDYIEAENYDKSVENPSVKTKCRLELRSKRISRSLQDEFMTKWFERLDTAFAHFEHVQDRQNANLLKLWTDDQALPKKDRRFFSLTAFLMQYREAIYTKRQMINLLKDIGVKSPESTAKHFKENHSIEYFSKTDLKTVINALKKATRSYFKN